MKRYAIKMTTTVLGGSRDRTSESPCIKDLALVCQVAKKDHSRESEMNKSLP